MLFWETYITSRKKRNIFEEEDETPIVKPVKKATPVKEKKNLFEEEE